MDAQTLIVLVSFAVLVALAGSVVCLGYRVSQLMFLGAAVLPITWLSRLHRYHITIGDSTFVLLWAAFILLTLLGLISGNRETRRLLRLPSRGVIVTFGTLVGIMVLSNALNSRDFNDIIRGLSGLMFVILPFAAAWSAVHWCRFDQTGIQRAVMALLLAGNLLALMSILTAIAPGVISELGVGVSYKVYGYTRAYSPLGGANGTGMALVMIYCLAFGQFLARRQRLFSTITLALSFVALLTTLARGALVGFCVANVFLVFWQWRGLARRIIVVSAFGVFLLIPLAYKLNQGYTLERINVGSAGALHGGSTTARLETMKASLYYGLSHAAIGGGWGLVYEKPRIRFAYRPGSADRTFLLGEHISLTTPHSLPALVFVESGLLALCALGLFAWSMWRALAVRSVGLGPEGTGLVHGFRAGVLAFMVVSLVQDNLFLSDQLAYCYYLYFFTGMAAATYYKLAAQRAYPVELSQAVTPSNHARGRGHEMSLGV